MDINSNFVYKKEKVLVVFAHPDDETLWFSSICLRYDVDLVCVTCGNNKKSRKERHHLLMIASKLLHVSDVSVLFYDDVFGKRLDIQKLKIDLYKYVSNNYSMVFTHGPFGDTNEHFHHQDISFVVNMLFDNVYCTAWNLYPDIVNLLTDSEYSLKKSIIGTVYQKEYKSLKAVYEISCIEKFIKLSRESIDIYYNSLVKDNGWHKELNKKFIDFNGGMYSPFECEFQLAIKTMIAGVCHNNIILIKSSEYYLFLKDKSDEEIALSVVDYKMDGDFLEPCDPVLKDIIENDQILVIVNISEIKVFSFINLLNKMRDGSVLLCGNNSKQINEVYGLIKNNFKKVLRNRVSPRWERMFHGSCKERLEIYKTGIVLYLLH